MSLELAGVYEVAEEIGVSRQRVYVLAQTYGFPKPLAVLRSGSVWDLSEIRRWRNEMRPESNATPRVPDRDPDRPADDPWDADAVRYLMPLTGRSRGWLMEHLRGQERLDPRDVDVARATARQHGVEVRAHPDGRTFHLFRTDSEAPTPYPASEAERRAWRKQAR